MAQRTSRINSLWFYFFLQESFARSGIVEGRVLLRLLSQSMTSWRRNRHCLPIRTAGISEHSAQRQIVREETPSVCAT
jgi:hypothetical protein